MSELQLDNSLIDDRYVVERRLSLGSYSEIFLAKDLAASSAEVILKALNPLLQGPPGEDLAETLLENFQNEAVALDSVRHPNIIRRLGHGTALDLAGTLFHFIVLEYLPGGDLRQHTPLSFDLTYFYLAQICSALGHAHSRGIIHRDLKPNNLLLSADRSVVKIADFGVAKIAPKAGEEITRVGADVYAPPEHHPFTPSRSAGDRARLTPSADMYSLAKSLITLLTGTSPKQFELRSIDHLPESIASQPWSASLAPILQRATQDRPEDRFQSVEDFWNAIEPLSEFTDESTKVAARGRILPSIPPAPPRPDFAGASGSLASGTARLVISLAARSESEKPFVQSTLAAGHDAPRSFSEERLEIPIQMQQAGAASQVRESESSAPRPKRTDGEFGPTFWHRLDARVAAYRNRLLAAVGILLFFTSVTLVYRQFNPRWGLAGQHAEHSEVVRDVSFRESPTQQSPPIGWIRSGARLRVIERTPDNWVHVEVLDWNGDATARASQGWVFGTFIETVPQ